MQYPLAESLTKREKDIVALLLQRNTNQEIADTLVISISTVKWYNNQIFSKLGVKNRRELVERAVELGLVANSEPPPSEPIHLSPQIGHRGPDSLMDRSDQPPIVASVPSTSDLGQSSAAESGQTDQSTVARRNRRRMLQNVRQYWIAGVLDRSLQHQIMLDLETRDETRQIDRRWRAGLLTYSVQNNADSDVDIEGVYERFKRNLLILGEPGSGKTTTLLILVRQLLHRAESDPDAALPVVFNLSSWAETRKNVGEWLLDELQAKYQVPRSVAEEWITQDVLALMLDGLDEVPSSAREACVQAINAFREQRGFTDMVVCCRTDDYEMLLTQLRLNGAVVVDPLGDETIDLYLDQVGRSGTIIRGLLRNDPSLLELCRSPLMLNVVLLAFKRFDPDAFAQLGSIERQRNYLLSRYVDYMFDRHEPANRLERRTTSKYLSWLADRMKRHSQTLFLIEDLQPSWLTAPERVKYERLFQMVIILLNVLFWGISAGLTVALGTTANWVPQVLVWSIVGAIWGWYLGRSNPWKVWFLAIPIAILAPIALSFGGGAAYDVGIVPRAVSYIIGMLLIPYLLNRHRYRRDRIQTMARLHFSVRRGKWWVAALGGVAGLTFSLERIVLSPSAVALAPIDLILPSLQATIGGIVVFWLLSCFNSEYIELTTTPNQGIRHSFQNALRVGSLVFVTLVVSISVGLRVADDNLSTLHGTLMPALPFSLSVALVFGLYPVVQHVVLRAILYRRGQMPKDLAEFLDSAAAIVLLRKVGGGYIFMHRHLLEYFATEYAHADAVSDR